MKKDREKKSEGVEAVEVPLEDVLDLHMFRPKEVPLLLEEYLHACRQAGMESVRIVHGKGRGILRERVRKLLEKSAVVSSFNEAPISAGGWGATLVKITEIDVFEKVFIEALDYGAKSMGFPLENAQMGLMALHAKEMLEWNRFVNLTAITEPRDMAEKLFLDVLPLCTLLAPSSRILDLGSGGGFPGMPLKVVRPDVRITLLDGKRKKASFLKQVIRVLGLKGIEALQGRAEDVFGKTGVLKGLYDVCVSKGVAEMDRQLRLSFPLVHSKGLVVAMKGAAVNEEIMAAGSTIEEMGLVYNKKPYKLPFSGAERSIVVFGKGGSGGEALGHL